MKLHLIILTSLILALTSCTEERESYIVHSKDIVESVYASATVKAEDEYRVSANVPGIVERSFVAEGDAIQVGSPLFKIKNQTSDLDVQNARLNYEKALKDYEGGSGQLQVIQLEIATAAENRKLDSINLVRQRDLWAKEIGSKSELEKQELAYQSSVNRYESALNRYSEAERQLKTNLEQARNNYTISRQNRSDFTIQSRIDGKVYAIYKEQGEFVGLQEGMALVGQDSSFILEMQVDERDIARVEIGQTIYISMDSYKDEVFQGRVSKINPLMNTTRQSFIVEAIFIEGPEKLYPNLSAEANIVIEQHEQTLVIPRQYLMDGNRVMIANQEIIEVETGIESLSEVEIVAGLSAQDEIIKPK